VAIENADQAMDAPNVDLIAQAPEVLNINSLHLSTSTLVKAPQTGDPVPIPSHMSTFYGFILSWCHVLTCTYIPQLFVLPARLSMSTGLISDLAAILILSSYVPLCAPSLTFPYLYRLSHTNISFYL
jgi:hypothetical protein